MRIDPIYKIREIAGEHVVIVQGRHGADMTRVIAFNDSARYLWDELRGRDFTPEEAARLLTERFEVDDATALRDAEAWIGKLRDCGMLITQGTDATSYRCGCSSSIWRRREAFRSPRSAAAARRG